MPLSDDMAGMVDRLLASGDAIEILRPTGCTCDLEITRGETDDYGISHVIVAHDSWCPSIRRRKARWS